MESISLRYLVEQKLGKFAHFLLYTILEWIIIALLFIDGFITLFCNEFAKFFDLRIPCLLCTRIDHIIRHTNTDIYYNESICEHHKKDISSLAYCHVHKKLSEIRSMCEGCLMSFATEKESDCDSHKSFNKENDYNSCFDDVKKDDSTENINRCSCCGEPLKTTSSLQKFIQRSSGANLSSLAQITTSTPRVVWKGDEVVRNVNLPKIRNRELKYMSDNESEVQDHDEDASNTEKQKSREDTKSATPLQPEPEDGEDSSKTPSFKGNKFFGISLTDSATSSPRWSNSPRWGNSPMWANKNNRKKEMEKMDLFSESIDLETSDNETLKKQLRLERKSLISLYMELDEERSAAAIAANNAMAMITRLQGEKASVQMEALQYQRMMEEQAEYDEEAIQLMRDIIVKRNEEIKLLEADLEVYRLRFGDLDRIELDECFDEDRGDGEFEFSVDLENEKLELLDKLANLVNEMSCSLEGDVESEEPKDESEDKELGEDKKEAIVREISETKGRLKAIENDNRFLNHAAIALQKDCQGRELLKEIAHHIRNRHSEKTIQ